jgi:Domain of unknown function (DUF4276)
LKTDIEKTLKDKSVYVTTFIDFYGLGSGFGNDSEKEQLRTNNEKNTYLERFMEKQIKDTRFIPYIQLHEFEGLLFASIQGFETYFSEDSAKIAAIEEIIKDYPNPEDINDSSLTAPSKRLLSIKPEYNKVLEGNLIVMENGITILLDKCPRFSAWITNLKSLNSLF